LNIAGISLHIYIVSDWKHVVTCTFNIRLYDKNSESDYFFFPLPKSEYFFQQHWDSEYFYGKKP
jgi:hypothetical protein